MSSLTRELENDPLPSDLQWDFGKEQLYVPACFLGMFHLLN